MSFARGCFAVFFFIALLSTGPAVADPELWQERRGSDIEVTGERLVQPSRARTLALDYSGMQRLLDTAPLEGKTPLSESSFELALPLPEGGFGRFVVVESPVMEARLAAKYPHIRTYLGQGLDDPTATVRFDTGPLGFRAQILRWPETSYIEPYQRGDLQHYVAFDKSALTRPDSERMRCVLTGEEIKDLPNFQKRSLAAKVSSGENLRTYRLAMAATGEYTGFYGGTVDGALGGIVTTMNRVNGIYEREVAVRMVLVANNDLIIYTNAGTDPYANTSGDLNANQTTIDSVIGSANYDVGHLVGTGGGGVAQLGSVCGSSKARGLTGSPSPIADAFDVDYVAHELGHQFAGNHTFNGSGGSCSGGNRNASTAYEPGSGITIQAYAGICAGDNLQPNSEDYFHRVSLNEILAFTTNPATGGSCGVLTSTGNSFPSVTAPADVTIPISTPFRLTATGSDPNGDTLTYVWEQFDLGTANPTGSIVDTANRPIFRSFDPSPSPTRVFPSLRYILDNANVAPATAPLPGTTTPSWLTAEVLPSTSRTMNFRVTARDNRAGGGGTNEDLILVTSTTAAGPFQVTAPNTAVSWAAGSSQTVTWNVAGTTANGVNTANVEIALSRDGGNTFPTVLLASTPNDGSETFTLPPGTPASTQARIRVAAVGNIFFDISNTNFTITGANTAPTLNVTASLTTRQGSPAVNGAVATVSDTQDAAGSLAVAVSGAPPELTVSVVNSSGTINMTAQAACTLVTPSGSSQTKTYPVLLTVTDSGGATTSLPVNILVGPNVRPTLGAYGNINLARNSSTTNAPAAAPADGNNNLVATTVSPITLPGSGPGATLSIASNGVVTVVTDATTSFGTYTVTAQSVDSCGAVALRRFTVTVPVTEPSFTLNSASVITGNGLIEPNECNQINLNLSNIGSNGTAITGSLSTSNPNLTVTQASANWANLNTGQSGTNLTPFQLSSSAGLSCGSTVNLNLTMNATGMLVPQVLPLSFLVGQPSFPLSENFDAVTAGTLPSGWTTEQTGTPPAAWTTSATGADSAPNAAFTNGRNQPGSNSLVTPSIALPAGSTPAVLRFRHTLNFETPNWDGGVLDVSVNGGAYSDIIAAGGSFQSGGYNGTVATGFANPLAGQPAWTGLQSAYGNVAVQLPVSFNGNNIRFRFRGGWDNSTTTSGANWRIDGLSLQAGFTCPGPGTGQCAGPVDLTITDVTANEGNAGLTNFNFTVNLSGPAGPGGVSFDIATANGTATAGSDYVANVLTSQTIPAGSSTYSFTVQVNGDSLFEAGENFVVNLSNVVGATVVDGQGQGTITNDDAAPTITINAPSVSEGNPPTSTPLNFVVSLNTASGLPVNFNYATNGAVGTATAGTDYTAVPSTAGSIAAGQLSITLPVTVIGDLLSEANETVVLDLSSISNANVTSLSGTGTINDDELPTLAINDVSIVEGNSGTSTLSFTVTRSGFSAAAVGFTFATANGSATAGSDYVTATGSGSIPSGGASATTSVSVTINGDAVFESSESFFVNLSAPSNATIADAQGVGTISNDDTAPTLAINDVSTVEGNSGTSNLLFTVTRTGLTELPATFTAATANNTATAPTDYLAALAGSTSIAAGGATGTTTLTATINGDAVVEANESFFVNLSAPGNATISDNQGIGTITNDDVAGITLTQTAGNTAVTEGGANDTYTLVLTSQPTANVSIALTGTQVTASPTPVVFTSLNWNLAQTVTVTAIDDAVIEGNHSGSVASVVSSSDASYSGFVLAPVSVAITDNDTPGATIVQSSGSTAVIEGGATDIYSVVLATQPSADVVITPSGSQVSVSPASLSFTSGNWNVPQDVTVTALDDNVVEGSHSGSITHTVMSSDSNYNGLSIAGVPGIAITDNDSATVQFAPTSVSQSEGTSPMAFTVTLTNPVASGVTLTVNSTPGTATSPADFTAISGGTVAFPPNSTTPQTVNVVIANDALDEDNEQYTLTLSGLTATGNVTLPAGTATATGTIQDEDATPTLSVSSPSQAEGNSGTAPMNFVVSLSAVSGRSVSFSRATQDGSALVANNDYQPLASAPVTIPAGQTSVTIPVQIVGDSTAEGSENFTLQLTSIVNATPSSTFGTGTIQEDDRFPLTFTASTSPNPSSLQQPVTVAVVLNQPPQAPLPTGTIAVAGPPGNGCTITLPALSCTYTPTVVGPSTLNLSYAGDPGNLPANASTTHTVLRFADLSVTKDDGRTVVNAGDVLTYTIVVRNDGPDTAINVQVEDLIPATLSNASWTCAGSACANASGTGSIQQTVTLPNNQQLTYTLTATVASGAAQTIDNLARVIVTAAAPSYVFDPDTADQIAIDVNVNDLIFRNGWE